MSGKHTGIRLVELFHKTTTISFNVVMIRITLLIVVVVELLQLAGAAQKKTWGPYDIIMKGGQHCEDEGTGQVTMGNKVSHVENGKYLYNGPLIMGIPIDENYKVYIDVQKRSSQGWRPRAYEYTLKGCEELLKHFRETFTSLFKAGGIKPLRCPFPQGNYTIVDWELDLKPRSITMMHYNTYKVVCGFYYKGVKVGCHIFIIEIVPKELH